MPIVVRPVPAPLIYANGLSAPAKEVVGHGTNVFHGNRDSFVSVGDSGHQNVLKVFAPVTITFVGYDTGAEVRYTFNSKKVNLGSNKYDPSHPPVVYSGGNGFDGDVLTIRAKAYHDGQVSKTTESVIHVITKNGVDGQVPPEEHGTTQTYVGDQAVKYSKTGK